MKLTKAQAIAFFALLIMATALSYHMVIENITLIKRANDLRAEVATLTEQQDATVYDTTAIDAMVKDAVGKVRMVEAQLVDDKDGELTLMDSMGELWSVSDVPITKQDNVLLWMDDNGTDALDDDVIINLWIEPFCG